MRQLFLAGFIAATLAIPAFAADQADKPAADQTAAAPTDKAADAAPAPKAPNKETLARVDGKDITKKDLDVFLAKLPPGVQMLPKAVLEPMALDQLINDQVLLKAAQDNHTADTPEYKKRLAEIQDQLLRETFLKSKVEKEVTDSAVREEFDKVKKDNPAQPEYQVRHMLVDTQDQAKDLIKQLDGGADFAKLASENNKGPEKAKAGELGFITAKEVVPEFGEAISKMKVGKYTEEPVKTQFGWHVIKLEDKRTRAAPKFADVKDQMRQRAEQNLVKDEITNLRKDAKVEVYSDNLDKMPSPKDSGN